MSEIAARRRAGLQGWAVPGSAHDRIVRWSKVLLPVAVGILIAVLTLAPLDRSGDVDRRVAVMALQGGYRAARLLRRLLLLTINRSRRRSRQHRRRCKNDADPSHDTHLTAPCTIFKRARPSRTMVRPPRSARSRCASNSPSRIVPDTGPALASWRVLRFTATSRVANW